jgi:hypothetical protein
MPQDLTGLGVALGIGLLLSAIVMLTLGGATVGWPSKM